MRTPRNRSRLLRTVAPVGLLSILLLPVGCESIGDFFDELGDDAEEIADDTGDAIEDAGDEIEDATDGAD